MFAAGAAGRLRAETPGTGALPALAAAGLVSNIAGAAIGVVAGNAISNALSGDEEKAVTEDGQPAQAAQPAAEAAPAAQPAVAQ